jgi:hypothetical protein
MGRLGHLNGLIGERVQVVGVDIFVPEPCALARGIEWGTCEQHSSLSEPDRTLTETLDTIRWPFGRATPQLQTPLRETLTVPSPTWQWPPKGHRDGSPPGQNADQVQQAAAHRRGAGTMATYAGMAAFSSIRRLDASAWRRTRRVRGPQATTLSDVL